MAGPVQVEHVEVRNDRGWRLAASLVLPSGGNRGVVVFAHGLGSGKDSPRNVAVAHALFTAGIGSLMPDLSGHGESEGDPDCGIEQFARDIESAFAFLKRRPELAGALLGLAGSSVGGTAAVCARVSLNVPASALVLRSPPLGGYTGLLKMATVPTLVIAGTLDPLLPSLREAVASCPPNIRLEEVPAGGHLFEEQPAFDAMVRLTVKWFRRHLGA
jgi:pimeloyl-ACP methyl ester carboxylesterase